MKKLFINSCLVLSILTSCKFKQQEAKQQTPTIDSTLQVKTTSILENKLTELNALLSLWKRRQGI